MSSSSESHSNPHESGSLEDLGAELERQLMVTEAYVLILSAPGDITFHSPLTQRMRRVELPPAALQHRIASLEAQLAEVNRLIEARDSGANQSGTDHQSHENVSPVESFFATLTVDGPSSVPSLIDDEGGESSESGPRTLSSASSQQADFGDASFLVDDEGVEDDQGGLQTLGTIPDQPIESSPASPSRPAEDPLQDLPEYEDPPNDSGRGEECSDSECGVFPSQHDDADSEDETGGSEDERSDNEDERSDYVLEEDSGSTNHQLVWIWLSFLEKIFIARGVPSLVAHALIVDQMALLTDDHTQRENPSAAPMDLWSSCGIPIAWDERLLFQRLLRLEEVPIVELSQMMRRIGANTLAAIAQARALR